MELSEREQTVKSELEKLLHKYSLQETISCVDEIVLSYVLGILESLGTQGDMEDTEDVEQFAEMMEAYLPGFAVISIPEVCEWMFSIADKLSSLSDGDSGNGQHTLTAYKTEESHGMHSVKNNTHTERKNSYTLTRTCQMEREHSASEEVPGACGDSDSRIRSDSRDTVGDCEALSVLHELCPGVCEAELQHCWQVAGGDAEEAARVLLYRQETGTAITVKPASSRPRKKSASSGLTSGCLVNDGSVKDTILAKYSFVDTKEDEKSYIPSLSLKEEKKLVRYRDGQVVSTKGERFSEIKRQESEEMKKTYVNLKPARKYRFH